jgi:hypothetical protein
LKGNKYLAGKSKAGKEEFELGVTSSAEELLPKQTSRNIKQRSTLMRSF